MKKNREENLFWESHSEVKKSKECWIKNVKLPRYKHKPHMNLEDSCDILENKTLVFKTFAEHIIKLYFFKMSRT